MPINRNPLTRDQKIGQMAQLRLSASRSNTSGRSDNVAPPSRFQSAVLGTRLSTDASKRQDVAITKASQPLLAGPEGNVRILEDPRGTLTGIPGYGQSISAVKAGQMALQKRIADERARGQKNIADMKFNTVSELAKSHGLPEHSFRTGNTRIGGQQFNLQAGITQTPFDFRKKFSKDQQVITLGGGRKIMLSGLSDDPELRKLQIELNEADRARNDKLKNEINTKAYNLLLERGGMSESQVAGMQAELESNIGALESGGSGDLARGFATSGGGVAQTDSERVAGFLNLGPDLDVKRRDDGTFQIVSKGDDIDFEVDPNIRAENEVNRQLERGLQDINDKYEDQLNILKNRAKTSIQAKKRLANMTREKNRAEDRFKEDVESKREEIFLSEQGRQGKLAAELAKNREVDAGKQLRQAQAEEELQRVYQLIDSGQATTIGGAIALIKEQDKVKTDKRLSFADVEEIFSGHLQEGKITPDNAFEKAVDLFDGNIEDAKKVVGSFGLRTKVQLKEDEKNYRKQAFNLTDEQLEEEETEKSLKERMQMGLNGELSDEDSDALEQELLLGSTKSAYVYRYKLNNPDSSPDEVERAWKRQSFVSNAKGKSTGSGKAKKALNTYSETLGELKNRIGVSITTPDELDDFLEGETHISVGQKNIIRNRVTTYDKVDQKRTWDLAEDFHEFLEEKALLGELDPDFVNEVRIDVEEAAAGLEEEEQANLYKAMKQKMGAAGVLFGTGEAALVEKTDAEVLDGLFLNEQ